MANNSTVKKVFNRNHLIIMALGNIIGSGVFLGSGAVISEAGPAAVIAYALGGLIMFLEVMFIAEMSIANPAPGSFRVHASEIFGPWMGFVNGWMFWSSGVLGMASEVTAAAIFSSFWFPRVPLWIFCLVYAAVMTVINFMDARGLSKVEAWLASIKVIALVVFIGFAILSLMKVLPFHMRFSSAGFHTLYDFAPNGFKGLFASMIMVLFSFTGTGIIGLAIAETQNPEKHVPPAIYIISATVTVLYVLSILFIVLLLPWNTISTSQSPFVAIMEDIGVPFGGAILNFIVLTAALSGLNSSMYSASRMLNSLSRDKQAPKLFLTTNRNGVPVYALGTSSAVLMLTAILSYILPEKVFVILAGASGFTAMFNWLTISITHYFYRKKLLRENPGKLKFKAPGYPYLSFLAVLLILTVMATAPLYPGQIVSLITGVVLVTVLLLIYFMFRPRQAHEGGGKRN